MTDHTPLDDELEMLEQMVDQPAYDAPQWLRSRILTENRLPILAPWAKDIDEFRKTTRWLYDHYRHTWAYHLARLPLYALRVALRVPAGLIRLLATATAWCRDDLGAAALGQVNENKEPQLHHKLDEQHREHVRNRTAVCLTAAAATLAAPLVLAAAQPEIQLLAALAAIGGMSKLGEQHDKPIVSRAVVATTAERLTADIVERALWQLRNIKDGDPIRFPNPIARDGAGWRADIDLPPGTTAAEVIEQRDKLAAALRRSQGSVWPEPAPDVHPGRLILWVGDEDMADAKPARWPLAKKGTVNLFDAVPFGVDQRGRPVAITLMYVSMVVGAIPRMGKTFTMRLLLLAAALDVRCELHVYDLKGTGDFSALEPVAHRYRAGDDDDDIAYALQDMRELRDEFRRRAKVIRGLPRNVCPENKVTDELASRRSLRLHPIAFVVDECQLLYQHPDHGEEFEEIVSDLAKRGPAVGIFVGNSTQEPNAKTLPPAISRNAALRFCLKVMDQVPNDAVLGTSAYKQGVRATLFKRGDLGIGLLAGEGDEPRVVRTYYVDNVQAEAIVERARALREAGGWLTGDAAGDPLDADQGDEHRLLVDILSVVPADEDKVWSSDVIDRLLTAHPTRYAKWDQSQLAFALKPFDVETKPISRRDGAKVDSRRGVHRDDVVEALERRQRVG